MEGTDIAQLIVDVLKGEGYEMDRDIRAWVRLYPDGTLKSAIEFRIVPKLADAILNMRTE